MDKYFLGLDIGTNSVGYAVTDENYNLIKAKGKKLWGVRLFEPAVSSEERRLKRANRRRLVRKKLKIEWLNDIFSEEINKIDKNMLSRIKFSNLWEDDKLEMNSNLNSKDSLFDKRIEVDGKPYQDRDYYKDYPTIFHLRKELMKKPAKDVRFLYLAIHNLLKHRGHFLYEGDFENSIPLKDLVEKMIEDMKNLEESNFSIINLQNLDGLEEKIKNDLKQKKVSNRDLKLKWYETFNAKTKSDKAIVDCFVNGKLNLNSIFELEEKIKIEFNSETVDEQLIQVQGFLSEDEYMLLEDISSVYSNISLKRILKDCNYVCEAMVERYEEHKEQLKKFKDFIRDYYNQYFSLIFRDKSTGNMKKEGCTTYASYIGRNIVNGKRVASTDKKDSENFYKFIKNLLNKEPENIIDKEKFEQRRNEFLDLIEDNNFLPKQRVKDNSVLPNKLLGEELKKILEINAQKFEFLNKIDENGLSNIEKIKQIFSFRIPYYVGPIGESENGWSKRISDEPLRPWTLSKIIDLEESEKGFIQKMVGKCTYIKSEFVLPKFSFLYSKFRVLNELNKLKINSENISVELKQKIYINLFQKYKKVTLKRIREFLCQENNISMEEAKKITISGIDKEFKNNLASYIDFACNENFGEEFVVKNYDALEEIISWITIISDKTRLINRIKKKYGDLFNENQLKVIKSLNYSDWGRLSYKFLEGIRFGNKETDEATTIIDELWNTNLNLQEIIFDEKYTLKEVLEKFEEKRIEGLDYELVDNMYCSAPVKRSIWQALKIVEEITETLGSKPDKIFVEVTRHDEEKGEKGRKYSRKDVISAHYSSKEFKSSVKNICSDLEELYEELGKCDKLSFRSDKLYLYFLQLGRCMYSGERIDLERLLLNNDMYDIDHIIPQSVIKDDSLNNRVLVLKTNNEKKDEKYPIRQYFPEWIEKNQVFWNHLLKLNLMTQEKYDRLMKTTYTEEEKAKFVARQLVETNQSNAALIDILKRYVDNPNNIIYSKAGHVSDFRKNHKIYKCRETNDFHHAKDAYLNIVVGYVLYNRFAQNSKDFHTKKDNENYNLTANMEKIFESFVSETYSKKLVWRGFKDIKRIRGICEKNDCLVTYMSFANLNGQYYNETICKSKYNDPKAKDDGSESRCPLKGDESNPLSNIERYGGYTNMKTAYFMLVESDDVKKKTRKKTIEAVPTYIYQKYKNQPDFEQKIFDFVVKDNKLINAKILVPKINLFSTLKIGKGEYLLSGRTNDRLVLHNFNQWRTNFEIERYIKILNKYAEIKLSKNENLLVYEGDTLILSKSPKSDKKGIYLTKDENLKLYDKIIEQVSKDIYGGLQISGLCEKLKEKRDMFISLKINEQADLLNGVIRRLSTGAMNADLSILKESKDSAKLRINKNITDIDISLIINSQTGIKRKIIKL